MAGKAEESLPVQSTPSLPEVEQISVATAATAPPATMASPPPFLINVKTTSSVTGATWGKVNLTAKAMTEGGFEYLYKQIFPPAEPNERLMKTFACYLSTTTGPVAGTLYVSTTRVAFCSDLPLSFIAPSGKEAWHYYKFVNNVRLNR